MKMLFKSLCVGMVISLLFTFLPFEAQCKDISDEVFRIHILANSDSKVDQALKLKVRDAVINSAQPLLSDVYSKEKAKEIISENLDFLTSVARDTVKENGFQYSVTAKVTRLDFSTRYYENVIMPSGEYDALQIRIGNAEGKNWWCVMYPTLCVYSAADNDSLEEELTASQYRIVTSDGEFELRFKAVEIFNSICAVFRLI